MTQQEDLVQFFKKVGIVCGGAIAAWTVAGALFGFAYRIATKPMMDAIADERAARVAADTLIVRKLDGIILDMNRLGVALQHPLWSDVRQHALEQVKR